MGRVRFLLDGEGCWAHSAQVGLKHAVYLAAALYHGDVAIFDDNLLLLGLLLWHLHGLQGLFLLVPKLPQLLAFPLILDDVRLFVCVWVLLCFVLHSGWVDHLLLNVDREVL